MCVAYWPHIRALVRMISFEKNLSFFLTKTSLYFAYLPLCLEVLVNFKNTHNHHISILINTLSVSSPIFNLVFRVFARLKHAFNRIIGML